MKKIAELIFFAGVNGVLPEKLMQSQVKLSGDLLQVAEKRFPLSRFRHIYVLAAGKAAASMSRGVEKVLGDKITNGHVVTKYGHGMNLNYLTLTEAGHPIPDAEGVKGTQKIVNIARKATEDDLVICLISGGASALMADFPEGVTLDDLKRTNELLTKCGANITEINTVRKHLSKIKGGQLARILFPATTVCLILSDVVGDRLDVIASGPTVGDSSSFADALTIIDKYSLQNRLPSSVLHYLLEGADGSIADTPKPDNPVFQNVHNYIIGSNGIALESSAKKAMELGFETHTVTDSIQEDVTETANFILKTIDNQKPTGNKPVCLLFGGEPTVKVSGKGLGGRNQHLALYLATKICCKKNITILCAGTDGTDGPTDAAGAVVDYETATKAVEKGIDPNHYLSNCDSYRFFQQVGGHIITGNTGTNVMDIIVAIVQ
ncbi:glycerate kinase [Petrimonas sulfuriphila]|jgi:glycerate 2-kinase|uniref:glycerate kinase type-2 family protein n=1 Tax=Petrimonas sulfuriphila TaxID=285070 RepID=UPI001DFB7119|nr:glycerate kinase [Petrimonas sp.]NLU29821.1 glycerate kinase [Bacteroidales bacterium]